MFGRLKRIAFPAAFILILVWATIAFLRFGNSYWLLGLFSFPAALWILNRPERGLWILVILYPFRYVPLSGIGSVSFYAFYIVLIFLSLTIIARGLQKALPFPNRAVRLSIGTMVLGAAIVSLLYDDLGDILKLSFRDIRVIEYGFYALLFLLFYNIIDERRKLLRIVHVHLMTIAVIALIGMVQRLTGARLLYEPIDSLFAIQINDPQLFSGAGTNPNYFSTLFLFAIPLALVFSLRATGIIQRLIYGGLLVLYISVLLMAQSRSALVGTGLSMLLVTYFELKRRGRTRTFILIAAGTAILILIGTRIFERYVNVNRMEAQSISRAFIPRSLQAFAAVKILARHPLGLSKDLYYDAVVSAGGEYMSPHNIFILHSIKSGVLGGLAFIVLLCITGKGVHRVRPGRRDTLMIGTQAALLGGMGAYLVHGMAHNIEWESLIWIFLAISWRYIRQENGSELKS